MKKLKKRWLGFITRGIGGAIGGGVTGALIFFVWGSFGCVLRPYPNSGSFNDAFIAGVLGYFSSFGCTFDGSFIKVVALGAATFSGLICAIGLGIGSTRVVVADVLVSSFAGGFFGIFCVGLGGPIGAFSGALGGVIWLIWLGLMNNNPE